jgi:hypothetical protein
MAQIELDLEISCCMMAPRSELYSKSRAVGLVGHQVSPKRYRDNLTEHCLWLLIVVYPPLFDQLTAIKSGFFK